MIVLFHQPTLYDTNIRNEIRKFVLKRQKKLYRMVECDLFNTSLFVLMSDVLYSVSQLLFLSLMCSRDLARAFSIERFWWWQSKWLLSDWDITTTRNEGEMLDTKSIVNRMFINELSIFYEPVAEWIK